MFDYSKSAFGKFKRYSLHNSRTKTGFSVVPGRGATLLDLTFGGQNVLDGYAQPEELDSMAWMKNVILYPFPNRLNAGRYSWAGKPQQFSVNDATTGNALHGFGAFQKFEVTRLLLTEVAAEITCRYADAGKNTGYPFPTTLEVTYGISDNHRFRVEFSVLNRHTEAIPVGLGWHPYFRLVPEVSRTALRMPDCERVEINERMLPTGQRTDFNSYKTPIGLGEAFLDNCFKIKKLDSIYRASIFGGGKKLTLAASGKLWPYLQVFTPPARTSIALEPMTCNIDAFNNHEGLLTLPPGGMWRGGFFVEFR